MSEWVIDNVTDFDSTISKALDTGKPVIVYCYGNWKEGTTDSWCPDCVAVDPIIKKVVNNANGILVEVRVGDRDSYKGKPQNQWRVFDKIKLVSIPTILKWDKNGEKGRFVSESIDEKTQKELEDLISL